MARCISLFEVDVAFVERYFAFSGSCSGDCAGYKECIHRTETLGESKLRVVDIVYFADEVIENVKEGLLK